MKIIRCILKNRTNYSFKIYYKYKWVNFRLFILYSHKKLFQVIPYPKVILFGLKWNKRNKRNKLNNNRNRNKKIYRLLQRNIKIKEITTLQSLLLSFVQYFC